MGIKSIKEIYEINKKALNRLKELKKEYSYFKAVYYYPYFNFLELLFWNNGNDYHIIQISNEQFLLFFMG